MQGHLSDHVKTVRVKVAVAAGTTDVEGDGVDMTGFDAVRFIALFGALTAGQVTTMKAQQSDDDGSADNYSDLEDSATAALGDDDDDDLLIVDVIRPTKKWVRPLIDRGTQNAVVDGVIAELYRSRDVPVTQDATVIEVVKTAHKGEGTA